MYIIFAKLILSFVALFDMDPVLLGIDITRGVVGHYSMLSRSQRTVS